MSDARQLLRLHPVRAAIMLLLLLIVGAIAVPHSVGASALLSVMPFWAVLTIASLGQHIVIQQRGFDLSVAGAMSIAAVLVTALPQFGADVPHVLGYVLLALAVGVVFGGINGLIVTLLNVPPLVTTIGVNAVLLGLTLYLSGGSASTAPRILTNFAVGRPIGLPDTILVMIVIAAVAIFIMERTVIGRRFIAVGVSAIAANALAIPTRRYVVATYATAGLFFAAAGVMLAGFLSTPSVFAGNDYMLTTVAAVILGGSPLTGGRGSLLATVIGAAFLTYMGQLVISLGFQTAMQYMIEAVIIIAGIGLPNLVRRQSLGARG